MHYYKFNIGDYASHTRHLSLMEDLAYRRLIDLYYLRDGRLEGCASDIARQIGMRDHIAEVTQVLSDFFNSEGIAWQHDRCDAEIEHFRQFLDKQKENGKRGGRPKKRPMGSEMDENAIPEKPKPIPDLTQTEPKKSLTTNQEPITNNQYIPSSKEEVSSGDDAPVSENEILEYWNTLAERHGLSRIAKLTPSRKQRLKARIKEFPEIESWATAFKNIERSAFLRGDNDRGWKANFDFLLQPGSFVKLIEGVYNG